VVDRDARPPAAADLGADADLRAEDRCRGAEVGSRAALGIGPGHQAGLEAPAIAEGRREVHAGAAPEIAIGINLRGGPQSEGRGAQMPERVAAQLDREGGRAVGVSDVVRTKAEHELAGTDRRGEQQRRGHEKGPG